MSRVINREDLKGKIIAGHRGNIVLECELRKLGEYLRTFRDFECAHEGIEHFTDKWLPKKGKNLLRLCVVATADIFDRYNHDTVNGGMDIYCCDGLTLMTGEYVMEERDERGKPGNIDEKYVSRSGERDQRMAITLGIGGPEIKVLTFLNEIQDFSYEGYKFYLLDAGNSHVE